MPKVHPFTVIAALPESLQPLRALASNLWWTWNHAARNLFIRISKEKSLTKLNPIELINSLSTQEINLLAKDKGFLAQLDVITKSFEQYKESRTWFTTELQAPQDMKIAYFSLEFGLHESLFLYSGGLGVLAGDHLKAASDLGVPISAVGLLYYEGYFSQYLNADGWQQESYPRINLTKQPITPALDASGKQISVAVNINNVDVIVKAWKTEVGNITLYLLDTNVDENELPYRAITSRLYGGDVHTRIQQEIILAIGGLRTLRALNIEPDVFHMNEGHSAFLAFEQIRELCIKKNLDFSEALLAVKSCNLFTTHTPVPAGNDVFPRELIEQYFSDFAKELGVKTDTLLKLGRVDENNNDEPFSMTVLALRASLFSNGVSRLHGHVSRNLWSNIWPGLPLEETPIQHVTNGIHTATWTGRDMADLYDRYLGPNWRNLTFLPETWESVDLIPDEELWRIRCRSRSLLVSYCRDRLRAQLTRRGAGRVEIENASQELNPEALTIGFARRFATYKRAALLLHDIERLIRIVNTSAKPVQFIFSGKAHPADNLGKDLIMRLIHAQRRPELRGKFVFLEDYDMNVARRMVQGVDIWLNNPRRPLEACGTSGIKVAVNGGLHMSVLDGWWFEAYDGENGFSIGQGEEYDDRSYQDEVESRAIYDLLEREMIPMFFNRSPSGVPEDWMNIIKHSIKHISPNFSAARMVAEYSKDYYCAIGQRNREIQRNDFKEIKETCKKIERFKNNWQHIKILNVETNNLDHLALGKTLPVKVTAQLGQFLPEELAVEVRFGLLDVTSQMHSSKIVRLVKGQPSSQAGVYVFEGTLEAIHAGTFGLSVRIVPVIEGKPCATVPSLITWWE